MGFGICLFGCGIIFGGLGVMIGGFGDFLVEGKFIGLFSWKLVVVVNDVWGGIGLDLLEWLVGGVGDFVVLFLDLLIWIVIFLVFSIGVF